MDSQDEERPTCSRTTQWRAKRRRLQANNQSRRKSVLRCESEDEDSGLEGGGDSHPGPVNIACHGMVDESIESGPSSQLSQHSVHSPEMAQPLVMSQEMSDDGSESEYEMLLNMRADVSSNDVNDNDELGDSDSNQIDSEDHTANRPHGIFPDNSQDDDPDDPQDPAGDSDSDSSTESTNDNPTFHCDNLLEIPLQQPVRNVSVKDAVLLKLALALRYNWSYDCLIDSFKTDNCIFGKNYFPSQKRKLWKILNRNEKCVRFIAYCSLCGDYLGVKKRLPNGPVVCTGGHETTKDKVKCFVSLDLRSQLRRFLNIPGIGAALKYRENRRKTENAITDIFDGAEYKRLEESGVISSEDFTFVLNTDGFKITKHGKNKAWPIFIRISELQPSLRQKSIILAGLWIGRKDPVMNTFLRSTVDDLNSLSQVGIKWKPDGVEEVTSKFVLLLTSMDSMARPAVYNMLTPAGYEACIFCGCIGVHLEGCVRYTYPEADEPHPVLRTDASLRENMIEAHVNRRVVAGVKGPSELMNVIGFDLVKGSASDDLHSIFEGVVKHHTELLLVDVGTTSTAEKVRTIDSRLEGVKPPKNVSRPACPICQRADWKASEWRNWLFYYSVPFLLGLVPRRYIDHLGMLAYAVFLLSQECIQPADIDVAEQLLQKYVATFQQYFGKEKMRFNVHLLLHFSECVRLWGPLWCYSTFHFESWNLKLMQFVKSPWAPEHQIVTKNLMKSFVEVSVFDETVSRSVREQLGEIMHYRRKRVRQVGRSYLLGKGRTRNFSEEERTCLEREGMRFQRATFYRRVIFEDSEYRSKDYPKGQHDCSLLYTTQETFCTVEIIVVLEDEETCGLFVTEHDVDVGNSPRKTHRCTEACQSRFTALHFN